MRPSEESRPAQCAIMPRRSACISILLSVLISSCGGTGLPSARPLNNPFTPTLIPGFSSANDRTVNWEGITSDGLRIGLKASADRVLGFYIELPEVPGDTCVFGAEGSELDGFDNFDLVAGPAGPPIIDGRFTVVSIAPMYAAFGQLANMADAQVSFTLAVASVVRRARVAVSVDSRRATMR